jgi:hypothetical protein
MRSAQSIRTVAALWLLGGMLAGCASGPRSGGVAAFKSPDAAVGALVSAIRAGSPDKIQAVLGPGSEDLVRSGDTVQDNNRRAKFLAMYDLRHQLTLAEDGSGDVTLCTGESDWPFPIPVMKDEHAGGWRFDTARGKNEILNRRIGNNELSAIQVCLAIVDAEREYAGRGAARTSSASTQPSTPEYPSRFISDKGQTNGLYWDAKPGEPESPLGPLVAAAADEGYQFSHHAPYHGYCYRILTAQGPHADGGAYDYHVYGRLIGGFAVIARPASYGNSGVMTFIVNHDGVVYQSDLGPTTEEIVRAIKAYDPGPEWSKAQ